MSPPYISVRRVLPSYVCCHRALPPCMLSTVVCVSLSCMCVYSRACVSTAVCGYVYRHVYRSCVVCVVVVESVCCLLVCVFITWSVASVCVYCRRICLSAVASYRRMCQSAVRVYLPPCMYAVSTVACMCICRACVSVTAMCVNLQCMSICCSVCLPPCVSRVCVYCCLLSVLCVACYRCVCLSVACRNMCQSRRVCLSAAVVSLLWGVCQTWCVSTASYAMVCLPVGLCVVACRCCVCPPSGVYIRHVCAAIVSVSLSRCSSVWPSACCLHACLSGCPRACCCLSGRRV